MHIVILTLRHSVKKLNFSRALFPEKYVLTNNQQIALIIAHFYSKFLHEQKYIPISDYVTLTSGKFESTQSTPRRTDMPPPIKGFSHTCQQHFYLFLLARHFEDIFSINLDAGQQIFHF